MYTGFTVITSLKMAKYRAFEIWICSEITMFETGESREFEMESREHHRVRFRFRMCSLDQGDQGRPNYLGSRDKIGALN